MLQLPLDESEHLSCSLTREGTKAMFGCLSFCGGRKKWNGEKGPICLKERRAFYFYYLNVGPLQIHHRRQNVK